MEARSLRVALFSGNYNYVRDGANKALNRLVGFLLANDVEVRVYSPTTKRPAFEPVGTLVPVKSWPFPFGRDEYRIAHGLPRDIRRDLETFAPNLIHVSAPDFLGHRAINWAKKRDLPILASMHTRFDTYLRYYHLGFLEPAMRALMRRFYNRCDYVVAPNESTARAMRELDMGRSIGIWARGIETAIFNSQQRDVAWRESLGIKPDDAVIGFLGRLVMEKGLDVVAETLALLQSQGVPHKVLIVGDGPARSWLSERLPHAIFAGFQSGDALGRAVASMDVFFNPSVTEAFGNVMLEAMACALPVVASSAPGATDLVRHGVTGSLSPPGDIKGFASALADYCKNPDLRQQHGMAGSQASMAYEWNAVNQAVLDAYLKLTNTALQ